MKNEMAVIDLLTAAESLECGDTVGTIPDGDDNGAIAVADLVESATAASQSKPNLHLPL